MSLELKNVAIGEYYTDVRYRIEHWGPTVVHDDSLTVSFPTNDHFKRKFQAKIHIVDCEADTYEEALDKLARWMTRLAQGIMERGNPVTDFSPMYDNKKPEVPDHISMGIKIPQREPARVVYDQGGLKVYDDDDEQ